MQRPRPDQVLRDRIERLRGRAGGRPTAPRRRRRVSRREREARRQRQVYWGMGIAGTLVVLVLGIGLLNEYVLKPRAVLATVGNTEIRRRDYWKVRSVDLIEEASQYQQFAGFVQGEQQTQYLQLASQRLDELDEVWGSTEVDETTLGRMIDDQVYLQNLEDLDLRITEEDIENHILQQFDPADGPLFTPTPTPTLIPERAAWATQTAVALTATAASGSATAGTPTATTPEASPGVGTPSTGASTGDPGIVASPVGTPAVGSPAASPDAASPIASTGPGTPQPTATTAPTPNAEQARATAEAGFAEYRENVFEEAHLSRTDYVRWIVRPAVAREKVEAVLEAQVGQSAEQVHAAHILVGTRDLAQSLYEQITQQGADFAEIALEQSTDEATAGNGGDLGWFTREQMVAPFAEAAFALQPGEVSEPVETRFGWHLIKVFEHEQDRPLTDEQISTLRQARIDQWLQEQKADTRISSELDPTPTPAAEQFEPPVDAPPAPTVTPTPAASPVASPTGP